MSYALIEKGRELSSVSCQSLQDALCRLDKIPFRQRRHADSAQHINGSFRSHHNLLKSNAFHLHIRKRLEATEQPCKSLRIELAE